LSLTSFCPHVNLVQLQDDDARIIIAVMYENQARETICAVSDTCVVVDVVII